MSGYPASTEPDFKALLRGLNAILKVADETGTGRKAVISASIRFLGKQGGIGLEIWSADLDSAHVLESKVGDLMRAVAAVALSHEHPVPIIRRYIGPSAGCSTWATTSRSPSPALRDRPGPPRRIVLAKARRNTVFGPSQWSLMVVFATARQ